jgi:hypothetical protein
MLGTHMNKSRSSGGALLAKAIPLAVSKKCLSRAALDVKRGRVQGVANLTREEGPSVGTGQLWGIMRLARLMPSRSEKEREV